MAEEQEYLIEYKDDKLLAWPRYTKKPYIILEITEKQMTPVSHPRLMSTEHCFIWVALEYLMDSVKGNNQRLNACMPLKLNDKNYMVHFYRIPTDNKKVKHRPYDPDKQCFLDDKLEES